MALRLTLTDGNGLQQLQAVFGSFIDTSVAATAADAASAAASANSAASSAANASGYASNASTSASAASGSASAAASSATAASTSATNASNSATAASTSATNAANSASAAATSATNAGTSATNAANSATAAATSASNAAATLANALTKANNLSDVASASTSRTNLGLGSAATQNTGTSGATVPLLSTANTWTLGQAFSVRPTFNGATPWDNSNLASPATTSMLMGRNLLINPLFLVNQRAYSSGTATTSANQYTWDRWRIVVSGQSATSAVSGNGLLITAPAGGLEQVVEGLHVVGGTYTLNWVGTATATVNGSAVTKGSQVTLTANANATVRFSGGTVGQPQLELGSVATIFDFRHYALEETLCKRYYRTGIYLFSGYSVAGGTFTIVDNFAITMRTTPTATVTAASYSNGSGFILANTSTVACTPQFTITAAGSGLVNAQGSFSAEL